MITDDILLTVKKAERSNSIQYLITFDNSLACSKFEVALHEALELAQAEVTPILDSLVRLTVRKD